MATRRNLYIAGQLGVDAEQLEYLINNAPTPEPLLPINWTASADDGPEGSPYAGITPTAYTGPQGGYTYGEPVPGRADAT
jgi:hypothetical protein